MMRIKDEESAASTYKDKQLGDNSRSLSRTFIHHSVLFTTSNMHFQTSLIASLAALSTAFAMPADTSPNNALKQRDSAQVILTVFPDGGCSSPDSRGCKNDHPPTLEPEHLINKAYNN